MSKLLADSDAAAVDYFESEGSILFDAYLMMRTMLRFKQSITSYDLKPLLRVLNRAVKERGL